MAAGNGSGRPYRLHARNLDNRLSEQLLTVDLLHAVEAMGASARALIRKAAEDEGRRICVQSASTVNDALEPLRQNGIDCHVDEDTVIARIVGIDASAVASHVAGRQLLRGLIQGLLDGAGLSFSVSPTRDSRQLRYRLASRPAVSASRRP